MKLRVVHYRREYYAIQYQTFFRRWKTLTVSLYLRNFEPVRDHPVISKDFDKLVAQAEQLAQPGALKQFIREQDEQFKADKLQFQKDAPERKAREKELEDHRRRQEEHEAELRKKFYEVKA